MTPQKINKVNMSEFELSNLANDGSSHADLFNTAVRIPRLSLPPGTAKKEQPLKSGLL